MSNFKIIVLLGVIAVGIVFALIGLVLLTGVYLEYRFQYRVWPERAALPKTAADIHDLRTGNWHDPDYLLKAKISKEEFEIYRKKLGYILLPEDNKKKPIWTLTIYSYDISEWWDPTNSGETYYNPDIGVFQAKGSMMKYENGYMYFFHWCGY